ncbi:hypothetical protein CRYUN_Cryun13aG0015900 [Craigia yunnanensis]
MLAACFSKGFFKMKVSLTKQKRSPTMTRYASVTSAARSTIAYTVLVGSDELLSRAWLYL